MEHEKPNLCFRLGLISGSGLVQLKVKQWLPIEIGETCVDHKLGLHQLRIGPYLEHKTTFLIEEDIIEYKCKRDVYRDGS